MGDSASVDSDNIDWNTEDELEIENFFGSPDLNSRNSDSGANRKAQKDDDPDDCTNINWDTEDEEEIQNFRNTDGGANIGAGEASSSSGSSYSRVLAYFVEMGFDEGIVEKAIHENGLQNEDSIIESLFASAAPEDTPQELQRARSRAISQEDLTDEDKMLSLEKMGYSWEEASIAMERCGPAALIDELTDFILAARIAKEADIFYEKAENDSKPNRIVSLDRQLQKRKRSEGWTRRSLAGAEQKVQLPNPMIGYGVPTLPIPSVVGRNLQAEAAGPPYFYFENVAITPKGVWETMKRFLYDIDPEFVDSKYFCAAARKRGYIHNLPVDKRFPILPLAPRTIHEAFPEMRKWWPTWDTRTQLNCLRTSVTSARVTENVRKTLEEWDSNPPQDVQKLVLNECRKWNLVWVGRNKVATLEPGEVEKLLGLPVNHTRGIGTTDRYKSLGNSFQVDTVAYHLSVLKNLFPGGINVLSLFSGIGGAEVALHRIGIPLKNVVSVEKSEVNRNVVRSWWEETEQKGHLIEYADVQDLTWGRLVELVNHLGGFDLVIGGSPCNNLTGTNRYSRDGLQGKDSALFHDYIRILDYVKRIMRM